MRFLVKGKLVPMCYPPVKVRQAYAGQFLKTLEDGSLLYDLGHRICPEYLK